MKGLLRRAAQSVHRPSHQLLPRAALSLDQHRARHGRHLLDLDQHFADRLRVAVQPGLARELAPVGQSTHRGRYVVDHDRLGVHLAEPTARGVARPIRARRHPTAPRRRPRPTSCSRTSARFCGSRSAPVSTNTSGLVRSRIPRTSSSGEMSSVCTPVRSSAPLSRTAGSTSVSIRATIMCAAMIRWLAPHNLDRVIHDRLQRRERVAHAAR